MATEMINRSGSTGVENSGRAPLVQADKALRSYRESGFDLSAAIGEPTDNSQQSGATIIRIRTEPYPHGGQDHKHVERIIFADNGFGIPLMTLPHVLSMGFSTRYGERKGLGRFGVGLKLAALSQAQRIDIYTRPRGSDRYYHTFIDLELIDRCEQEYIDATEVDGYPPECQQLMIDPQGTEFSSGTLVIWSNVDRLTEGGKFGSSLQERLQDLTKFLARAYRKFIDNGLSIELNGRLVTLHDPLFLLDNPRVETKFGNLKAKEIERGTITIDGENVEYIVTLAPEKFRDRRSFGGRAERLGEEYKDLYIPDNDGKMSILRNSREIYYDLVPRLYPGGVEKSGIDRFIGVEISFPATLDEFFQVRNVKRGAEPVSKLREEIKGKLKRPIEAARREIRAHWDEVDNREREAQKEHEKATNAVKRAEETSPHGKAGAEVSPDEAEQKINELLEDIDISKSEDPATVEQQIRAQIQATPITLVDAGWPGKELLDIVHLNGKAIVKINHRHPFIREIYDPLKELAGKDPSDVSAEELVRMARKVEASIDVLFMAYAKAENMNPDADDVYSDLRSYWGQFTRAYVKELLADM